MKKVISLLLVFVIVMTAFSVSNFTSNAYYVGSRSLAEGDDGMTRVYSYVQELSTDGLWEFDVEETITRTFHTPDEGSSNNIYYNTYYGSYYIKNVKYLGNSESVTVNNLNWDSEIRGGGLVLGENDYWIEYYGANRYKCFDAHTFDGCKSLRSIYADASSTYYKSIDGILYCNYEEYKYDVGWIKGYYLIRCPEGKVSSSITLSQNVLGINEGAIGGCYNLKNINVEDSNPQLMSIDGVVFNKDCSELIAFPSGRVTDNYVIPDSCVSVKAGAFSDCPYVTGVTMPTKGLSVESTKNIVDDCQNLKKVVAKYNTDISYADNPYITEIIVPDGITAINNGAFSGCTGIKSVTIPRSVTKIHENAFSGCENLDDVYYDGTKAEWESVRIFDNNSYLTYADIHFAGEDTPTVKDGFVEENDKTYYYINGEMVTSKLMTIDGKKYYFGKDGVMYTNKLISVSGKKYYMGADGAAYTKKLISVSGKKYYMGADGVAYTSRLISVSGKKYYMGKDGVAYTKKLISVDGKKYYMGSDGVAYTSKLISVDGKKYYMGKDGVAYKSKLISVSGKKYYIGKDCIAYKSKFASLSGKKYYFGSDCVMYKSKTFSVSGVKWKADSKGVCKKV